MVKPTDAGNSPASTAHAAGGSTPAGSKGRPAASTGGEEDPGAALDDPAMRDAMRGEASESEQKVADKLRREQEDAARAAGGKSDRKG